MGRAIKRRAFRAEVPKTEAFQILTDATKKGRRAVRRVVLKGR